jgi:hypothetical protein
MMRLNMKYTYFYKNIENIQELTVYEYWESNYWTTYRPISDLISHGNNHVSEAGTCRDFSNKN